MVVTAFDARKLTIRKYSSYNIRKLDYLFHCSRRKNIILFSNPKAAGSTLKRLLQLIETDGDENRIPENVHTRNGLLYAAFLELGDSFQNIFESDKYFRFCFVRNPYTRILSCYLDKIRGRNRARYLSKLGVDGKRELTLTEFLQLLQSRRNLYKNPHWAPQSYLIRPDTIRYSFIGRFEHLHEHLSPDRAAGL